MSVGNDDFSGRNLAFAKLAWVLVPVIYVAASAAFVADLLRTNTLAYGIIYIPLIGTGLLHRQKRTLWVLTAVSIFLVIIGAFFPTPDPDLPNLFSNRILSILAILATAFLVFHARTIQDRLAAETRRAETAERLRTEILSNIGREMRTPLHTTIAMLGLLLTNCPPEQRGPLGKMRAGSQQLLLTLDNLIGLTQIDESSPDLQRTDVGILLRKAVANTRIMAEDSGVRLEFNRDSARNAQWGSQADTAEDTQADDQPRAGVFEAFVDPHMTRRILDNLLFNAIQVTPASRTVYVTIRQTPGDVLIDVGDTGDGLPPHLLEDSLDDTAVMTETLLTPTIGVGLTFGRRLAEVMGGSLTVLSEPDIGTTVTLSLPRAIG